ncbi:UNVERIFIED_CONTAM: hypothetical protein FKN15_013171 [Acipenser sinensis]
MPSPLPLALLILLPGLPSPHSVSRIGPFSPPITFSTSSPLSQTSGYPLTWPLPPSGILSQVSSISSSSSPPTPFNPEGPPETLASSSSSRLPISLESPVSQPSACGTLTSLKSPEITSSIHQDFKTDSCIKIQKFRNLVPGSDPNPRLISPYSKTIVN